MSKRESGLGRLVETKVWKITRENGHFEQRLFGDGYRMWRWVLLRGLLIGENRGDGSGEFERRGGRAIVSVLRVRGSLKRRRFRELVQLEKTAEKEISLLAHRGMRVSGATHRRRPVKERSS